MFLLTHFFVRTSYFASILRNFWLCNRTEEKSVALDVPKPVGEYLAAEEVKDADALSRCFSEDGIVHDEGQEYHGRDSIRQWKQAADAKYRYVLQTVHVQNFGDLVTVRARLTGEFPGSPVELDHIFKLSNNKIVSLEIRS
jgi:ketosteroid isomerase-like protein